MTDVVAAKKMIKQALELLMMANEALGVEPASVTPDVVKNDTSKPPYYPEYAKYSQPPKPTQPTEQTTQQPTQIVKFKNAEDLKASFPPDLQEYLSVTEATEHWNLKPVKWLDGDKWDRVNDEARSFGGKWVSDQKASRWEIPK